MVADPIAAAVASVDRPTAHSRPERRVRVEYGMPTGRAAVLDLPLDLRVDEAMSLIAFVATQLPGEIARASNPSKIVAVRRGKT